MCAFGERLLIFLKVLVFFALKAEILGGASLDCWFKTVVFREFGCLNLFLGLRVFDGAVALMLYGQV